MKKEITVYVHPGVLDHLKDEPDSDLVGSTVFIRPRDNWALKATLVIEMPERKIEITESELVTAIGKHAQLFGVTTQKIINELFGDKRDRDFVKKSEG
jgi:hypothetical protein